MRVLRFANVCASVALLGVGCSSANFDVPATSGGDAAAGQDSVGSPDVETTDAAIGSDDGVDPGDVATALDTAAAADVTVGPPPCAAPSATATDVYVDRGSSGAGLGNATCPFHSILEASALPWSASSGKRTIHVAAGAYAELNVIHISDHVVLAGAGPLATQITGGGVCSAGVGNCVLEVDGGAEVFGFTANTNGSNGIVTTAAGAKPPLVHHVVVTGSSGATSGILVRASADLGPQVDSHGNAVGLHTIGAGNVHVLAPTAADTNAFSDNQTHGINVEGGAVLLFDGGELARNAVNGIRLAGTASMAHTIVNAHIHDNGAAGLSVSNAASASVRGSRFESNRLGIAITRTNANGLDLGNSTSPGHNVFGTKLAVTRNTVAGICVYMVATGSVPAVGNSWSVCAPTYTSVASCDAVPTSGYLDVLFAPQTLTVLPVDASSCAAP
jgi:hypothetical protein